MKDNDIRKEFVQEDIIESPKIKITQCSNGFILNKRFNNGEEQTEVVEGVFQTLAKRICVDILNDLENYFQGTDSLEFEYKIITQINPF